MSTLSRDVGAFVWAIVRRWRVLITSGLAVAAIAVWEHYTQKSVPWLVFLFVAVAYLLVSMFLTWRENRVAADKAQQQLKEIQEPRLEFVIQDGCCCRHPSLAAIGVANLHPKSVHDALVYIDIPEIGLRDCVLAWAGMMVNKGLPIHQGPLSRHHHTDYFAMVGDAPNQFIIHTGYSDCAVDAGAYVAEFCVKGADVTATTARVEILFALPRSLSVRLL